MEEFEIWVGEFILEVDREDRLEYRLVAFPEEKNDRRESRGGEEHCCYGLYTLIVDLEAYRSHTLIRLEMKPHLMGHAYNQVWNKASGQSADKTSKR